MEQGMRNRRHFEEHFKVDAVRSLDESGKSVSEVARELGVGRTDLRR
jgi:transposase-like protein